MEKVQDHSVYVMPCVDGSNGLSQQKWKKKNPKQRVSTLLDKVHSIVTSGHTPQDPFIAMELAHSTQPFRTSILKLPLLCVREKQMSPRLLVVIHISVCITIIIQRFCIYETVFLFVWGFFLASQLLIFLSWHVEKNDLGLACD